jgi:hypothetical protein
MGVFNSSILTHFPVHFIFCLIFIFTSGDRAGQKKHPVRTLRTGWLRSKGRLP